MSKRYQPVDLARLRTRSVRERSHKESVSRMAQLPAIGASASELIDSLPDTLAARSFRRVVTAIVEACRHDRPVVLAFGAHLIKVGCSPIVIDLIRRGVVRAIACHGACAIHDVELAMLGETSEEVADTIRDGSFGMVAETMEFFDAVGALAQEKSLGLGEAVGRLLVERDPPHRDRSLFVAAAEAAIPACVHVALGTDTVHMSPGVSGAALGTASMQDFRLICDVVADLGAKDGEQVGGVWLNVGSAVVMPEVFLKAVSVARNLGANLDAMTTASFDMLRHYRPHANVVTRPVAAGRGFEIVGHHEIMLPLLRQAIIERLS
jgi:hypothetical protein